jgi:hypothetical protein
MMKSGSKGKTEKKIELEGVRGEGRKKGPQPTQASNPDQEYRRRAPHNIIDRKRRVEGGDERGEHDQDGDEHVYEHRRRGRVGSFQ